MFEGETPLEVLVQHLEAAPVPPSRRSVTHVPPVMDALILDCLMKDPSERPDAATLAERLAAYAVLDPWTEAQARDWWERHLPFAHDGDASRPVP